MDTSHPPSHPPDRKWEEALTERDRERQGNRGDRSRKGGGGWIEMGSLSGALL